jgi:hypothetical protein
MDLTGILECKAVTKTLHSHRSVRHSVGEEARTALRVRVLQRPILPVSFCTSVHLLLTLIDAPLALTRARPPYTTRPGTTLQAPCGSKAQKNGVAAG